MRQGAVDHLKTYRSVPGRRRILEVCQIGNSSCDLLPGTDTFLITGEGKSADLLGHMTRGIMPMDREHMVGAGPELPVAQRQRWFFQ